jgi:hypothetical protein
MNFMLVYVRIKQRSSAPSPLRNTSREKKVKQMSTEG